MSARSEQLDSPKHCLDDTLAGVERFPEVMGVRASTLDPQLRERACQDLAQDLDGDVEADVYIVEADPGSLAAELREATELAGYNGAIVFAVRSTGPEGDWYKAARVTSALGGEE